MLVFVTCWMSEIDSISFLSDDLNVVHCSFTTFILKVHDLRVSVIYPVIISCLIYFTWTGRKRLNFTIVQIALRFIHEEIYNINKTQIMKLRYIERYYLKL